MTMHQFQSSINIKNYLLPIDWIVFFACGLLCILLIKYAKRKQGSVLEYMLMGRQLSMPLFIATLVATWYGGIFGVTQIAFENGIYNLFTQGIFWYITYIIFALCVVKKLRSYNIVSLPELVQKIYGAKSAKIAAICIFFKTLPITYAISIGFFLKLLLPLTLWQATICGVVLITLYAIYGGMRAIVYSDIVLFVVMCAGVACVLIVSMIQFGGLSFLKQSLPVSYFNPCSTKSLVNTLVWFFIACCTTFISPAFYQRCLAAASDKIATKGILIATIIWFLFDICTTFGAMYARAIIPEADSGLAYITYGVQLLPNGLRGLLLASIAAAILGTLDSFLFIASNILFYDLPKIRLKKSSSIIISSLLTIGLALSFDSKIESVWLTFKSFFSVCLLVPILFGYLWPKLASEKVFIINAIAACLSMLIWNNLYIGLLVNVLVFAGYYLTLETRITTLIERSRRII